MQDDQLWALMAGQAISSSLTGNEDRGHTDLLDVLVGMLLITGMALAGTTVGLAYGARAGWITVVAILVIAWIAWQIPHTRKTVKTRHLEQRAGALWMSFIGQFAPPVQYAAGVLGDTLPGVAPVWVSLQRECWQMWERVGLGGLNVGGWPEVVLVEPTPVGLRAVVGMVPGQSPNDWTQAESKIANYLQCDKVTMTIGRGAVELELRAIDPLETSLPALVPSEPVDLVRGPAVGVTERGRWWFFPVRGVHTLIVAGSGGGKSYLLWAIIAGIAPAIRDGLVKLHGADLKGAIELGFANAGEILFDSLVYDQHTTLRLLVWLEAEVDARMARLRGHARKHEPTVAEPLHVLIIDEALMLSEFVDNAHRKLIEVVMGKLLTQGRAVGVSLIVTTHDPSKETNKVRDFYMSRIALKTNSKHHAGMIFHDAAERGIAPHDISPATPGVGYCEVVNEDNPAESEVMRVRSFEMTDDSIRWVVDNYAKPKEDRAVYSAEADARAARCPGCAKTKQRVSVTKGQ